MTSSITQSQPASSRTTPEDVLVDAALPEELEALVASVLSRCRLWRRERTDVARELCAHFRDGLTRGTPVHELAGAFGDPRDAARLITSARKRLRPLWWRQARAALRGCGILLALMVVLYGALTIRYLAGSAPLDRNVLAEINAPIYAIAESQRAWPLYLEARRRFGTSAEFMSDARFAEPKHPGDESWDALVEWTGAQREAFEILRSAAARPRLGFIYRGGPDPELVEVLLAHATETDLLSDETLTHLTHGLAAFGGGRISITGAHERLMIEDFLQRFFTDNGRGDGRFVGGPNVDAVYEDWGVAQPAGAPILRAARPVQSALMPSRRTILRDLDAFMAALAVDDALPPWRHDERSSDALYRRLVTSSFSAVLPRTRAFMSWGDRGPFSTALARRDRLEATIAAAKTMLTLERFSRDHGAWPERLTQLVPAYLAEVPRDPFGGAALRYLPPTSDRATPVLYSIGADGVDHGGVPPETTGGRFATSDLQRLGQFRSDEPLPEVDRKVLERARGDWVIWPVVPEIDEPDDGQHHDHAHMIAR